MDHLKQYLLNRIEQSKDLEEIEILATFCAMINYAQYVKELDPDLHRRATEFGFETVDVPNVEFVKEDSNDIEIIFEDEGENNE